MGGMLGVLARMEEPRSRLRDQHWLSRFNRKGPGLKGRGPGLRWRCFLQCQMADIQKGAHVPMVVVLIL